jgi:hypothetical protein
MTPNRTTGWTFSVVAPNVVDPGAVAGLPARQRQLWILAESAVLGMLGSVSGLALGAALAAAVLQWLGGDLGGGYFPGTSPRLAWPVPELSACALLDGAADDDDDEDEEETVGAADLLLRSASSRRLESRSVLHSSSNRRISSACAA